MGAQVMFVRNDILPGKALFQRQNRQDHRGMPGETIEVDCPGEAGTIEVGPVTWENIEYTVDPETTEISQKIIGTFNQYPAETGLGHHHPQKPGTHL